MRSGDVIAGRYRLEEAVGTGGMGIVWRATDLELRRVVAVKRASTGDGEQIRREARIGAGLQHPNVVAVFDVIVEVGERWLVMEYLSARSLAEILRADGPMMPSRAAHVGAQIAAALAAMHAKGMVHRDITPGNVLIAEDGTAKLADLGIAMWADVTLTGGAQSPGTPGYMAPEVTGGSAATPASDMYSLGVMLSAAIEGADGAEPTTPEPAPAANGRNSSLAGVLSALVNPDPAGRPTADKARELFLNVVSGKTRSRRRVVAAVGFGVVALLVAGVLVSLSWPENTPNGAVAAGTTGEPSIGSDGSPAPRREVPGLPTAGDAKLLFGVGDQANSALATELVRDTPTRMLTTWYHKPSDLATKVSWRENVVASSYAEGFALHLIVASWPGNDPELAVDTKYGTGCGRRHPLSNDFLRHMRTLARIFAGRAEDPSLYVTLFHGINTYACTDGDYRANAAYYQALKDRYLEVREIFRAEAPNSLMALGWQGWQANDDNPVSGAGRSMFGHFADVLKVSDFQSVLTMQPDDNVKHVRQAVRALGEYGPVMVSAYGAKEVPADVVDRDLRTLLTDSSLAELTNLGLFAWNFNEEGTLIRAGRGTHDFVKDVVRRAGREPR